MSDNRWEFPELKRKTYMPNRVSLKFHSNPNQFIFCKVKYLIFAFYIKNVVLTIFLVMFHQRHTSWECTECTRNHAKDLVQVLWYLEKLCKICCWNMRILFNFMCLLNVIQKQNKKKSFSFSLFFQSFSAKLFFIWYFFLVRIFHAKRDIQDGSLRYFVPRLW